MGKYASDAHVLGTCIKYCTNASLLGEDGTYVWRPNIVGSIIGKDGLTAFWAPGNATGAFKLNTERASHSNAGVGTQSRNGVLFRASSSNSVYTDSGKVYPLSLALNFIIKC